MANANLKIDPQGTKRWYDEDGNPHREDGPAVEYHDGDQFWYIHGKLHREDGPACEYNGGQKYWYYNGKFIECYSTKEFIRLINLKAFW